MVSPLIRTNKPIPFFRLPPRSNQRQCPSAVISSHCFFWQSLYRLQPRQPARTRSPTSSRTAPSPPPSLTPTSSTPGASRTRPSGSTPREPALTTSFRPPTFLRSPHPPHHRS